MDGIFDAKKICNTIDEHKPTMVLVVVQIALAGVNILYKLAANDGMNLRVLVAYRYIFAAAFMLPLAFFVERNKRPKMTWKVLFQGALCGLIGGSLAQNMYLEGLALTSATLATATINLTPAITFILAISFGLEKLEWKEAAGKGKVIGTLIGLVGAMLLTFDKGPNITLWSTHTDLLKNGKHHAGHVAKSHPHHQRVLGALLALGGSACYALWMIIQTKINEQYPCHYSSTALMTIMASIQSTVFALFMDSNWSQWKLGWNIRLLTVAYSGCLASGLMFMLAAWCLHKRGPLFVSVFSPLILLIVAIVGSLLLDEKLHLQSAIGSILIVCGLYVVLWGKGKEMERMCQLKSKLSSEKSKDEKIVINSSSAENNKNETSTDIHS